LISASACAAPAENAISTSPWLRTSSTEFGFAACRRPLRFQDDRTDQIRDQFAHQFRAAPVVIEIGIMPGNSRDHVGGERHDLEIVDREQSGPQAIVDVVGVIGYVVGDRGYLCLQRAKLQSSRSYVLM